VLAVIYLLLSILNVTIVGKREGMIIAALGSLMYAGVIGAEVVGLLPYGPDSPHWAIVHPSRSSMISAGVLVATVNVIATWMVSILVERIRTREVALEEANRQLAELSQHDPLTQLYNRRHLLARIEAELARVRRGHPMALLMIDLDRFKRVNDERGHLAGDELLTKMADALGAATRATDVAGRYGGDEFLVLLPDADIDSARVAAERLLKEIRTVGSDGELSVTASVGLAVASRSDNLTDLLRRADEAAYRAKQAGGDRLELAP
jgi:diguanylate cyclase (GGDEF)-like protein